MEWVTNHWVEIGAVVTGVLSIAGIIVKWTKTKKDDKALEEVKSIWRKISGGKV